MTCKTCESIEERRGDVIYSDPHSHVVLPEQAAGKGHVKIYSKNHAEKIEDLEHEEVQHLFRVGNVVAGILFEQLGAQGTNILLDEGTAFDEHLCLDVVARSEGDGMNFRWDADQMDEARLEEAQKRIKDKADLIGHEQPQKGEPSLPQDQSNEKIDTSEDNPMIEHLNKLP